MGYTMTTASKGNLLMVFGLRQKPGADHEKFSGPIWYLAGGLRPYLGRSSTNWAHWKSLEMLPPNFGAISNWQLGMAAWLYASLRSWFDMPGRVPRQSCGNQEALDVWLCHKILQPRHEQAHCQSLGQTFCNSDVSSQYVSNYFIMFWRLRQTWKHGNTWKYMEDTVPRSSAKMSIRFLFAYTVSVSALDGHFMSLYGTWLISSTS